MDQQKRSTGFTLDGHAFKWFLNDAGHHYTQKATHAPAVDFWLDHVQAKYDNGTLTLNDMAALKALWSDETGWEQHNYAQNRAYKMLQADKALPVGANSW